MGVQAHFAASGPKTTADRIRDPTRGTFRVVAGMSMLSRSFRSKGEVVGRTSASSPSLARMEPLWHVPSMFGRRTGARRLTGAPAPRQAL